MKQILVNSSFALILVLAIVLQTTTYLLSLKLLNLKVFKLWKIFLSLLFTVVSIVSFFYLAPALNSLPLIYTVHSAVFQAVIIMSGLAIPAALTQVIFFFVLKKQWRKGVGVKKLIGLIVVSSLASSIITVVTFFAMTAASYSIYPCSLNPC